MMLCLVTDRYRLSGGGPFDVARRRLVEQARWAAQSGIDLVQIRERDLADRQLAGLVAEVVNATRGSRTRVVVNDRLDIALACGADGLHLRHDSPAAEAVRRVVPAGFIIGRSVSTAAEAIAAGPVDYLIAGTVFPTASKPTTSGCLGLEGLAEIVRATPVRVLAIGGISADKLNEVSATGAAGVAAISLFVQWFDRHETPS